MNGIKPPYKLKSQTAQHFHFLVPQVTRKWWWAGGHGGLATERSGSERYNGASTPKRDISRHFFRNPAFTTELRILGKTFGLKSPKPTLPQQDGIVPHKTGIVHVRFIWRSKSLEYFYKYLPTSQKCCRFRHILILGSNNIGVQSSVWTLATVGTRSGCSRPSQLSL